MPAPLLQQANALLALAINSATIGGAAVAGFLVAAFGSGWAIAVDAATFLLAASLFALMRLPAVARTASQNFMHDLVTGWREFRSRTWLWVIVLQFSFLLMVCVGALSVLGPAVADAELGGAKAWGAILTGQAAGLVVGGLLGLRFRPRRMLVAATVGILAIPLPLVAIGFPLSVPAIVATAFVAGVGSEIFGLLWQTTVQQEIPPDKLSRVYSYDALGSIALVPVGYAIAGPIADAIGIRATLWGAAAIGFAVTLPVLAVRDVQRARAPPGRRIIFAPCRGLQSPPRSRRSCRSPIPQSSRRSSRMVRPTLSPRGTPGRTASSCSTWTRAARGCSTSGTTHAYR